MHLNSNYGRATTTGCILVYINLKFPYLQSILGEFNREQDAFIKGQDNRGPGSAVPPWVGAHNERGLKEECLLLSAVSTKFWSWVFRPLSRGISIVGKDLGISAFEGKNTIKQPLDQH